MDVNSGGSFGANPLRKEIGIGRATVIDELIIKWPATGTIQIFKNCHTRSIYKNQRRYESDGENESESPPI